ncbi:Integrase catalytic domain-containing protein, partial [Aphis craccivora]
MRFIEQEKKLRIYNIDTPGTIQFRHGELFPNTICSLVLGSSGCGKTNFNILCVINCFTKFAWTVPLKSKTGKAVTNTMSKILLDRSPKFLQLDNGKEFYNTIFDTLMIKYNIHKYSMFSIMKACVVERFNRTLKEKMFREFTDCGSHKWISILPKLLNEHNNSKHRTIGMTPTKADLNPSPVTIKQREINNEKIKFKVGDNVRIGTQKGVFTKGYLPNWSSEIFEILKINRTLPVTYQLQNYTGQPIAGCFYSSEIHKTNHPNEYLIEKIIILKLVKQKKNISNLEQSIKSYTNKIDKIEHLIEQNNKSMLVLEEQTENLQLTCVDIVQRMSYTAASLEKIRENIKGIKKIFPSIQSQFNTIEAIIYFQCIFGVNNKYFIKEMSIVDTEIWATQHWIFKNSKSMQDSKSQKTNKWLLHKFHQLSINYGDIEYGEL